MKNKIYTLALFLGLLYSCSNTKYLKEGQYLYTGSKITIIDDTISKAKRKELENSFSAQLSPKPNSSFLSLRPKLWIYNVAGEPIKEKGLRNWLRNKVGEEPVLLTDVDRNFNRDLIVNIAENQGYFNARARFDTLTKGRKVEVEYKVTPKAQYIIERVSFPKDTSVLSKNIAETATNTLLELGKPFNLETVKAERVRIDNVLKEKGFYYFDPNHVIVQVDSTVSKHKVDLLIRVKPDVPDLAKYPYTIDNIIVLADYNLQNQNNRNDSLRRRTNFRRRGEIEKYNDEYYIVDPKKKFSPKIFDRALYFKSGDLYNRTNHNLSLNRLITLGTFKFVKNQFILKDSTNHTFNVMYMLTPDQFKSLRLEVLGKTNSASYIGSELNFNWRHKNFLKGAELFTASLYGAFDYQLGGEKENNNIFRVGGNVSLVWPRLVAPFNFTSSSGFVPKTRVKLGYEYQKRTQLYTLHNYNSSFAYIWKETARKEHELNVIDITYIAPESVSEKYEEQMKDNLALQRVVEKQLIFGPMYKYTYTNTLTPKKHTYHYTGSLDLSANITGLIWGANAKKDNQKEIFKVPFSQYAKTEHSLTYYMKMNEKSQLAARMIAGVAYPYGNSTYMPFSKQFYVGGVNSVRAFRARTLGPGSYDPRTQDASFFFDQAGDIKLEMNVEYRANLFSFLNAAAFIDAGNVWLFNEDRTKPGGTFSSDFISEIAVGAGFGLRFDFSIVVLRTDLAFPLRVPYYDKNERWNFKNIDFGDKSWRRDNMILNIAIGYPF